MEEKKPTYRNLMEDVVLRYLDESMAASFTTVDQWFIQWRNTYKAPSSPVTPHTKNLLMPVLALADAGSFLL